MNLDKIVKKIRNTELSESDVLKYGRILITEFAKEYHKKQLTLTDVSQQRELLIAYEKNHYTPQEWALASKQCIEDIDNFLAINCG